MNNLYSDLKDNKLIKIPVQLIRWLKTGIKSIPSGHLDTLQWVSVQIEIANNPNKRRPAITLPARAKLQRAAPGPLVSVALIYCAQTTNYTELKLTLYCCLV